MTQFRFLKKSLALLCLLTTCLSTAQTVNTSYKTLINAKLAGLDKTKIPHKLLINQAMEFAELSDYSGAITTTNWATRGKFTDVYNTLLMARTQTAVTGLVSPTVFKTNWDNLREPNKIVLSGLYYKYNKFKPNAYPNSLVNNNGVVTDKYVGGVWQNPYEDKQVFAVAAPILVYNSLSLQVTLPASLWYTNQSLAVQSIAIDFADGLGYQSMTFGQIKTINYSAAGTFEWKYKLTLTNAQILYSHSKLKVDIPVIDAPPTSGTARATASACSNTIQTIPFSGTKQLGGIANSALLQIKYSPNNPDCKIRNPLIVVEGFDSGLLGVENPFGEKRYENFISSTYFSLNLYFTAIDYDIVYVNFKKGRDDLKRNAYLVEDIIKWVNVQKANASSTAQNVVLGQSMGGVIARFALRDMEVLGQAHQTKLFISHDAPQQGANIPVGIQYFARHLADQFIGTPVGDYNISIGGNSGINIDDIQNLFNAQGTKQLLANYIDSSSTLNNSVFNSFQTELRNLGYPNQTRNIALSNGNHCANTQEFAPSSTLFALNGGASTTALTTALTTLFQPITNLGAIYGAFVFNEPGLLLGLLPGSSSFDMDFYAKALPSSGSSGLVYHGYISYTKVLFDFFGWRPQITTTLTERNNNNPVSLSIDNYPGGKYQLPFNFQSSQINNDWINAGINVYLAPSYNFISTTSALDIGGGAVLLNNQDYLTKYNAATPPVAPKNSPFANFTTSFPNSGNLNEPHISFNDRNGNWLAKEIDNIANNNDIFDCTFICSDTQISGSNVLCASGNFSVPSNGTVYNWLITEGSSLVSLTGNNTPNISLTNLNNGSGYITIQATYGDGGAKCGNVVLTKRIWVGVPLLNELIYNNNASVALCIAPIDPLVMSIPTGEVLAIYDGLTTAEKNLNANWEWEKINDLIMISGSRNRRSVCPLFIGESGFRVRVKNACGWSDWTDTTLTITLPPSSGARKAPNVFKVYPNPSKSIVNVSLKDTNNIPVNGSNISGELFDMMGQLKATVQITNNQAIFSVQNLISGIYVLKIRINGQVENHQIAVE